MSSLLWDKADLRFQEQDLYSLNEWAEHHAKECVFMEAILKGSAFSTYQIRYCQNLKTFRTGMRCLCGQEHFVDEGKIEE